jgi:hypothetical protein
MLFRGATRHEDLRRQHCQATSVVALCPPMRQRVDLRQPPFSPSRSVLAATSAVQRNCSALPVCLPSAISRTTRPASARAKHASIPIDGSRPRTSRPRQASSGSAQSRFIRAVYDGCEPYNKRIFDRFETLFVRLMVSHGNSLKRYTHSSHRLPFTCARFRRSPSSARWMTSARASAETLSVNLDRSRR